MRANPLLILFLGLFLLSGCVTETTGRQKKEVDREDVVEKLINLGVGYLNQGDYSRAKVNLRKALDIDSRSILAHTMFGVLFEREGEDQLAEEHFRKAIRFDPDFSLARNNYGGFLFAQGRFEEAVEQLLAATDDRFYLKRPHAFENLGVSYLSLGETVKAEEAFVRAVELNFSQSRALLELANIRFDQQNFVESRSLYRRHRSVSGQSARSLWLCVRLARVFDDKDQGASCSLLLKNIFPASDEYKQYKKSL
ncbi:MAG: type IV pilus biogenesis/stability protein PilW [Gammaproteobacteria bacterium]|nr:type IV pilus biogenesis/stability protein PilW [Gammaproteobacteria bacterium]